MTNVLFWAAVVGLLALTAFFLALVGVTFLMLAQVEITGREL